MYSYTLDLRGVRYWRVTSIRAASVRFRLPPAARPGLAAVTGGNTVGGGAKKAALCTNGAPTNEVAVAGAAGGGASTLTEKSFASWPLHDLRCDAQPRSRATLPHRVHVYSISPPSRSMILPRGALPRVLLPLPRLPLAVLGWAEHGVRGQGMLMPMAWSCGVRRAQNVAMGQAWGFGLGVWKTADVSARSALKIVIGYGQMREISWIWGQTREILPLWQTCEISDARHPHTTHP